MAESKPKAAIDYPIVHPSQSVSFTLENFNTAIRTSGVTLVHYRGIACPVGLVEADGDDRRPHSHHQHCSNGFIYVKTGTIIGLFQSNSKDLKLTENGRMDGSTVQVTLPTFYEDSPSSVLPVIMDRFFLQDEAIFVPTWERFNLSETGRDKLRYPVLEVTDLVDSTGKFYNCGTDFTISDGKIVWNDTSWPGIDPETQKGKVCTVRYNYRPFWYVQRLLHEVRVAQTEAIGGTRQTTRFPQTVLLQREYVFDSEQRDTEIAQTSRMVKLPSNRGFENNDIDNLGIK